MLSSSPVPHVHYIVYLASLFEKAHGAIAKNLSVAFAVVLVRLLFM
jgi:hypothetical protein